MISSKAYSHGMKSCFNLLHFSSFSRDQGLEQLPLGHHLKGLAPDAIKHLTDAHIDFVFHWLGLLSLEKSSSSSKLSDIWTVNPDLR